MNEELNLNYSGTITYDNLRQIIFDYYRETKGIQLSSISIDYLKGKLSGDNVSQPFFIVNNDMGESRFDISKEEIKKIFGIYLKNKNYELVDLKYGEMVEFVYKDGRKLEQSVEQKKTDQLQELTRMARERRKFTILQRERVMNDAKGAKNRSAIMAGTCILGAAVSAYFSGQDFNQMLQSELNAIYSWDALGQYIQNLGPLTTFLSAGAGGFIVKYLKNSRKFKQAQDEFIDFNNSLEGQQTLGGNANAKSR